MPKAYFLEDRIRGVSHYITKFGALSVGRNPKCNISTLNPKTIDPGYSDEEKLAAGHVSGIHFYISYESDGHVYIWDNKSTNGLYARVEQGNDITRIGEKTRIPPGTSIFASLKYEFFLSKRTIDIHTQRIAEEKASTGTTQILLPGDWK